MAGYLADIRANAKKFLQGQNAIVKFLKSVPGGVGFSIESGNKNYNVTISSMSYNNVATAIEDNHIKILYAIPKLIKPGAAAAYEHKGNRLLIPESDAPGFVDASVLHEATHAWLDLNMKRMNRISNETICYIADSLYTLVTGGAKSDDPIRQWAYPIARRLLNTKRSKTVSWDDSDVLGLWHAIVDHPVYFHGSADIIMNDG